MSARSYEHGRTYPFPATKDRALNAESNDESKTSLLSPQPVLRGDKREGLTFAESAAWARERAKLHKAALPILGEERTEMILGYYSSELSYTRTANNDDHIEERWWSGQRSINRIETPTGVRTIIETGLKGVHEATVYTLDEETRSYKESTEIRPTGLPEIKATIEVDNDGKNLAYRMDTSLNVAVRNGLQPDVSMQDPFYQAALRDPGATFRETVQRNGDMVITNQTIVYSDTYRDDQGNIVHYGNEKKVLRVPESVRILQQPEVLPGKLSSGVKIFDVKESVAA